MKRIWYWPAWKVTEPFKVGVWTGGDEFLRRTSCLSLGPLGTFIYAHEDDEWYARINDATQAYLVATESPGDDE